MQNTANLSQPSFYSVEDVQRLLGIGRNTAYKLASEKGFPSIYVGNRIIIPTDLFQNWIAEQAARGGEKYGRRTKR